MISEVLFSVESLCSPQQNAKRHSGKLQAFTEVEFCSNNLRSFNIVLDFFPSVFMVNAVTSDRKTGSTKFLNFRADLGKLRKIVAWALKYGNFAQI